MTYTYTPEFQKQEEAKSLSSITPDELQRRYEASLSTAVPTSTKVSASVTSKLPPNGQNTIVSGKDSYVWNATTGQYDLQQPKTILPASSKGVVTSDPLAAVERQKQQDQAKADAEKAAELARLTTDKQIKDIRDSLSNGLTSPTPVDYVKKYDELRASQGVADVETELAAIKAKKQDLQMQFSKFKQNEPSGVTAGFASGRISEEGQKIQDQLDRLDLEERNAIDKLNMKNSYISNVMDLTKRTYDDAVAQYDKEFNKNLQIQNILDSRAKEGQNDAQAYLSATANLIANSGKSWAEVDPAMKEQIKQMELKAGWAPGTLETFSRTKPKANLIGSVNGFDANGNGVTTLMYDEGDGNIKMTKVYTGTTAPKLLTPGAVGAGLDEQSQLRAKIMRLPAAQQDAAFASIAVIKNAKSLLDLLDLGVQTGPYAGHKQEVEQKLGMSSDAFNQFVAGSTAFTANFIKSLSGVQVSDKERDFLSNALPDPTNQESVNRTNVEKLTEFIKNKYELQLGIRFSDYPDEIPEIAGIKDVSGFMPQ